MKHNRTCWGVAGANNLAALLALYHTGQLRRLLRGWEAHGDPSASCTVTGPLSAWDVRNGSTGSYIPPHTLSATSLPDVVKRWMNMRPLSTMTSFG